METKQIESFKPVFNKPDCTMLGIEISKDNLSNKLQIYWTLLSLKSLSGNQFDNIISDRITITDSDYNTFKANYTLDYAFSYVANILGLTIYV